MAEELGKDFANFFRKADISKELNPIKTSVEEMQTRLEEYESLLATVRNDADMATKVNIPQILANKDNLNELCKKIDDLERFVDKVNDNLENLERVVEIAEEELGVNDYSLKGIFKPIFGKSRDQNQCRSNLENGILKKPEIFRTSDHFANSDNTSDS